MAEGTVHPEGIEDIDGNEDLRAERAEQAGEAGLDVQKNVGSYSLDGEVQDFRGVGVADNPGTAEEDTRLACQWQFITVSLTDMLDEAVLPGSKYTVTLTVYLNKGIADFEGERDSQVSGEGALEPVG